MKPFNLQECMAGKPVVTRDGRLYKFGAYNPDAANSFCRIVGWIDGFLYAHDDNGVYVHNQPGSSTDLFMAAEKKECWVCLYENTTTGVFLSCIGQSKEQAEQLAPKSPYYRIIKTVKILEEEI